MKKLLLLLTITLSFFSINSYGQDHLFNWAVSNGGKGHVDFTKTTVDNAGNIYSIGILEIDTVDFDPGTLEVNLIPSGGNRDIFIQKLDASGNLLWVKQIGGIYDDEAHGFCLDALGNVYITGFYKDTVDFNPGVGYDPLYSDAYGDGFVLKLDASGNFVWVVQFGNTLRSETGQDITINNAGDVIVIGNFRGTIDFDPGVGVANLSSSGVNWYDTYVVSLTSSGSYNWAKSFGGTTNYDFGRKVKTDQNDNIYIYGYYDSLYGDSTNFDPGAGSQLHIPFGGRDVFLLKLDNTGAFSWVKTLENAFNIEDHDFVLDDNGNSYISGSFSDTLYHDPLHTNYSVGNNTSFYLAKYNTSGDLIWVRTSDGASFEYAYGLALDNNSDLYVTGYFQGTVDFDLGTGTSNLSTPIGPQYGYLLKMDTSSSFIWIKEITTTDRMIGRSIAFDNNNDLILSGIYKGTGDFDPGANSYNLSTINYYDMFIVKLKLCNLTTSTITESTCDSYTSPSGNYVWTSSNIYFDTIPNNGGCDSVITINLTINTVDTTVTQSGNILTANTSGATYQWLDCNNGNAIISGETNQTFTATSNGNFAVEVTQNGCTDTSACLGVTTVGISESNFTNNLSLYPNPTTGRFSIDLGEVFNQTNIEVLDLTGKVLFEKTVEYKQIVNLNFEISKGIYFVKITANNKQTIIKLIKQ